MRGSLLLLLLAAAAPAATAQRRGGGGANRNATIDVPALCGAVKSGCNLLSV